MASNPPAKVYSAAIVGIEAHVVEVEVDVSYGLRSFEIVGLPDKAIEESKERIGVALKSSGFRSPHSQPLRVLVNLAPADIKKEGSLYDLPIALGFLLASKQISFNPEDTLFVGELSLDGKVRAIKGALAVSLLAQKHRYKTVLVPRENAQEAAVVTAHARELKVVGADTLKETVEHLRGAGVVPSVSYSPKQEKTANPPLLSFIHGQEYAKRALEIAAAGMHNLMFQGPPGTGKTLLAKALADLLPPLEFEQSLEVTKIYSVAGLLPQHQALLTQPPFRNPHHTSSEVALIGGGNPPRAGEITLAHHGILFLDEFPEFHRDVLESLRQPIEEGSITLLRARHHLRLPARFLLVAAANPCPCGYYRDAERQCNCVPSSIQKYRRKLSGPLMDRIDMFIEVPQVKYEELASAEPGELEKVRAMRERVLAARSSQRERFGEVRTNSQMELAEIAKNCLLDRQSQDIMRKYVDSGRLSARGYHRVLKLARTIADLEQSENILFEHLSEALSYRIREDFT